MYSGWSSQSKKDDDNNFGYGGRSSRWGPSGYDGIPRSDRHGGSGGGYGGNKYGSGEPLTVNLAGMMGNVKITFTNRYAEVVALRRDIDPTSVRVAGYRMPTADAAQLSTAEHTLLVSEDVFANTRCPVVYVELYQGCRIELLCVDKRFYVKDLSTPTVALTSWLRHLPSSATELERIGDLICPQSATVDIELSEVCVFLHVSDPPDDVICANCNKPGHSLAICVGPVELEGDITGCPVCNTKEHNFDDCRVPYPPGKTMFDILVGDRGNRPQLRTNANIMALSASKGKRASYPWTKKFSVSQPNHVWNMFDYTRNDPNDLRIDPDGPGADVLKERLAGLSLADLEAQTYGN